MLRLLACYEGEPFTGDLSPFHHLSGKMDDDALWAFLRALCQYGCKAEPTSPRLAIETLLRRKTQVIGGGIVVESGAYRLFPSCCCGLEDWVEWRNLTKGSPGPWLGHDPDPWIDTSGERAILHNDLPTEQEALAVEYDHLVEALDQTAIELSHFLERLRAWLRTVDPQNAERLGKKVSEWFHITPLSPWSRDLPGDA